MKHAKLSRIEFLKACGLGAATLPSFWADAAEVPADQKPILRFAVASDLHYGQARTPFDEYASNMVGWFNKEAEKGLNRVFLNGDLVQDSSAALLALRDKHLSRLKTPYYCIKGNHDYLDPDPNSAAASWQKIWGYPSNHVITDGDFTFIMANTSAPHKSNVYLAADHDWLKEQLEQHKGAAGIFVFIHIAQRKAGVNGWPKHGVHKPEEMKKGEAVMKLLESTPNVRAVFHGHNHNQTGHLTSGELRYFFDSHVGGSWGAKRGYRVVEVYADHRIFSYQWNAQDNKISNSNTLSK